MVFNEKMSTKMLLLLLQGKTITIQGVLSTTRRGLT